MIRNETFNAETGMMTVTVIDVAASTVTVTVDGDQIEARTLTEDEVAAYEAEQEARIKAEAPDLTEVVAAKLVEAANADPQPWEADKRYLPGAIVTDGEGGDRWRNDLGTVNVWPLTERHARWTNLDFVEPVGPQPWEPWSGFPEDLYNIGAEVAWDNPAFPQYSVWRSKIDANVQEPGEDGTFHRWWEPIG